MVIVAEGLFIKVAEQEEWFDADVGSAQRPQILQPVGMGFTCEAGFDARGAEARR